MQQQEQPVSPPPAARRIGPWLLWFAVLGGAMAWTAHLLVSWGVVELVCTSGHTDVAGLPLRGVVAAATIGPLLVALLALAVSWRLHRNAVDVEEHADRSVRRAEFMAELGLWSNMFSVLIIVFGGIAVLVLSPCAR